MTSVPWLFASLLTTTGPSADAVDETGPVSTTGDPGGDLVAEPPADADAGLEPSTDAGWDADVGADLDAEPEPEPDATTTATTPAPADPEPADGSDLAPFGGRAGLGVIRTIAGVNGINFRYFVADQFAIGASIGAAVFTYRENDPTTVDICPGPTCELENLRTTAAVGANIEGIYFAHLGKAAGRLPFRADFGLGGRFGILSIVNASDLPNNLDDPLEFHVEIPLIVQLMFGNNFALAPEFGVDFRIVPGSRADGDANPGFTGPPSNGVSGPGFGFDITSGIGLFAGASMHYYFGGKG